MLVFLRVFFKISTHISTLCTVRVWSLRASTGFPKIIRVTSTQKHQKNSYARGLVLCQVPLETIMRVPQNARLSIGPKSIQCLEVCCLFGTNLLYRKPRFFLQWISYRPFNRDQRNLTGDLVCFFIFTPLVIISTYL